MGQPDQQINGRGSVLKYWHVILVLVLQVVVFVYTYGRSMQRLDDLDRRVTTIESDKMISRDEFNAWKVDMEERLGRIEGAILERNREEEQLEGK